MAIAEGITAAGIFEAALKKVAVSVLLGAGRSVIKFFSEFERDFGGHISQSFERCSVVRTILNRDESVDLLSIYINLHFQCGDSKAVDDIELVELVRLNKRIIISGIGGGGKSMFMRYLWLSFFENPQSKVPVFIELRRFNDVTVDDFSTFLFKYIVDPKSRTTEADFDRALKDGRFALILDGFDEVKEERRAAIEMEIMRLSRSYPEIIIVVSGRPDERFSGWQAFNTFHVQPLTREQVINLIGKLTYDQKIKRKFIQRIKKDLFRRHKSFLSSPLLATMMLLTFDQFADIPEKIYLFYEQAFETLFAKHDATKEAYKCQIFTGLPIDVFKKLVAYMCLFSYYEQSYEFSDTEIRGYIRKAIEMTGSDLNPELFMRDLTESVCLLQRDGLNLVFTHRSFQEYFAAYCLSSLVSNRMIDICPQIVGRIQDNVIPMCFDMNQEIIERSYIGPKIKEIISNYDADSDKDEIYRYMEVFDGFILANRF